MILFYVHRWCHRQDIRFANAINSRHREQDIDYLKTIRRYQIRPYLLVVGPMTDYTLV